eukprot:992236-Amphidinium_carterae.1
MTRFLKGVRVTGVCKNRASGAVSEGESGLRFPRGLTPFVAVGHQLLLFRHADAEAAPAFVLCNACGRYAAKKWGALGDPCDHERAKRGSVFSNTRKGRHPSGNARGAGYAPDPNTDLSGVDLRA